jgi:hypothetical protein
MQSDIYARQLILLENKEVIRQSLKQFSSVVNLGVGVKETNGSLTDQICYRVYVSKKLPLDEIPFGQLIPNQLHGFVTDILDWEEYEEMVFDTSTARPLLGGVQIKNDHYRFDGVRGVGTLGCLAVVDDGSNKLVGLTNEHVVRINPADNIIGKDVGQPYKIKKCCGCTYNVIGKVLGAVKNFEVDCAIIDLDSEIASEIIRNDNRGEIKEIGRLTGSAPAVVTDIVTKRGAATGLTRGTVVDVGFDLTNQILIRPLPAFPRFADFGDSGSVIVNAANKVVGLLWAANRTQRAEGVANHIQPVLSALNIRIFVAPPPTTISVDPADLQTHQVPSTILPASLAVQHFVTAKGTGDVLLRATFAEPVDNAKITWTSSDAGAPVSPVSAGDNSLVKISRNVPAGLKTTITVFVEGEFAKQFCVWIVWAVGSVTETHNPAGQNSSDNNLFSITGGFNFEFRIQPASIIPDNPILDDVPDFKGDKTVDPPDVPATDTDVYQQGIGLAGGANKKWDVSRRLIHKIVNPSNVTLPEDPSDPGGVIFNTNYSTFPSDPVVGNDDRGVLEDEMNDPYDDFKRITSRDNPQFFLRNADGAIGDTVEHRVNFQEFARLQIGDSWYVISDYLLWRFHLKFKKLSATQWGDDNSILALNHDDF